MFERADEYSLAFLLFQNNYYAHKLTIHKEFQEFQEFS